MRSARESCRFSGAASAIAAKGRLRPTQAIEESIRNDGRGRNDEQSEPAPPELKTMRIEVGEDGVGVLTLDRPDAFNAMSPEMIAELPIAFSWCADQAPLRALIVTGAGNAFCAGGDINWFRKGAEDESVDLPASVRHGADVLHQGIIDLRRIPCPVIAAINGPAAGAGFSLALACDLRIAAESAFFAPAYGRIGASPDGGMTYFLPRVVGPSRALEILLEDPNMRARDALAEGLVTEVVEPEALMESARARAAEAGGDGAPLRADGETAGRGQHREPDRRPPAAGAPRDRRQHGDRGPAQRASKPSSAARSRSSTAAERPAEPRRRGSRIGIE